MRISVITINRNNEVGLKRTIASVLAQSYRDFEYILVDGASSDGSADVVRQAGANTSVKWVSEPDSGIYNAMNKGIRMASGEYLLFLNSGDTFASISTLADIKERLDGSDIIIGRVNVVSGERIIRQSKQYEEQDLGMFNLYLQGVPHQASFIRRSLLLEHPYDENLKINSDWKFFLQTIVLENRTVKLIPDFVANYDDAGISSTHMDWLLDERERVFCDLVPDRIAKEYLAVFPHYYEVKRVKWLLEHPLYYKIYRMVASAGMCLLK